MNDQWSGKTLSSAVRANLAAAEPVVEPAGHPAREQPVAGRRGLTVPPSPVPVPEAGADGAGEVAGATR